MKFPFSISYITISYRSLFFVLFTFHAINLNAETVYITDSLLVGLHEEKSIDSAILKVLPTGTVLEVIKRDNNFVKVRDPKDVTGWISNSYLVTNDPNKNENTDTNIAQSKIRELEAELENVKIQQSTLYQEQEQALDTGELVRLKAENVKLNQQLLSDKLKSGELQAKLAELRNQISQSGNNKQFTNQIELLTETNAQLEEKIKHLQAGSTTTISIPENLSMFNPFIVTAIALFIGLLTGIFFMDWRTRRRHGGLRF